MKKRLFAAGLIFLCLLGLLVWGSALLRTTGRQLNVQLDAVQSFAQAEQWPKAHQAAQTACTLLRQRQAALCWFVPFDLVAQLDESLCTLPGLALTRDAALAGETERARSKLRALTVLFSRPI